MKDRADVNVEIGSVLRGGEQHVACPKCGPHGVHLETVKVLPAPPSDHRYKTLEVGFECEFCLTLWTVDFTFSKGTVLVGRSTPSTKGHTVVSDFENHHIPEPIEELMIEYTEKRGA